MNDKKRIAMMQEIIDSASKNVNDRTIAKKLGIPVMQVLGVRLFFGIRKYRPCIDIREEYKMVASNSVNFSLRPLAMDFDLLPNKKYHFKAVGSNPKKRTITLALRETK